MAGYHPSARSTSRIVESIDSPPELGIVCAAEGAAAGKLDEIGGKPGVGSGA
jgi:hypothetical protein